MDRIRGIAALCALAFVVLATQALAANRAWTGAAGNNRLSDARNWGGTLPAAGDRLVFAVPAAATLLNDFPAGTAFAGLDLTGPGNVVITGAALTLTGDHPITVNVVAGKVAAGFALDLDLSMPAAEAIVELQEGAGGGSSLTFQRGRRIAFGPGVVKLLAFGLNSAIRVDAEIARIDPNASTRLELRGASIFLDGPNTFGGQIESYADALTIGRPASLSTPNVVTVVQRGLIALTGGPVGAPVTYEEPLVFRDNAEPKLLITLGEVVLKGALVLDGAVGLRASGNLSLEGSWNGFGTLTTASGGGSVITLRNANNFQGALQVDNGVFRIGIDGALARTFVIVEREGTLELGATVSQVREFVCRGTLSVTLGGAIRTLGIPRTAQCGLQLAAPASFPPPPNTIYTVLDPLSGQPTEGFVGFPDGTFTTVNGIAMRVTHRAGANGNGFGLVTGPFRVTRVAGDEQSTNVGELLPQRFSARAIDANGAALAGAPVVFSSSCGTFNGAASARVLADGNGLAVSPPFRAQASATSACRVLAALEGTTPEASRTQFSVVIFDPDLRVQDLWWAGPAENGWGMSLVQHGDTVFGVIYAYDDAGNPVWYVMPGGTWNATHNVYSGPLYLAHGSPYFAYDVARFSSGNPVGNATLTFSDASTATLEYSIGSATGRKGISRQPFGVPASGNFTDRSDLWWGGAAQNGWGIAVLQQVNTLFSVWFTYDANGAPTWFVMPGGTWTSATTYEGRVYKTRGAPWVGVNYDASRFQATEVGGYRFEFGAAGATFHYTVEGRSGALAITRQPF